MKLIIFGGAFDPIHIGHLNMAEEAHKQLGADVFFVLAPISVWKETSAPIEDKINMINLSIKDKPYFHLDLFEINSGKNTNYSITFFSIAPYVNLNFETYPYEKR
jgi:nicotinate-nucleotide adenylyltransferase